MYLSTESGRLKSFKCIFFLNLSRSCTGPRTQRKTQARHMTQNVTHREQLTNTSDLHTVGQSGGATSHPPHAEAHLSAHVRIAPCRAAWRPARQPLRRKSVAAGCELAGRAAAGLADVAACCEPCWPPPAAPGRICSSYTRRKRPVHMWAHHPAHTSLGYTSVVSREGCQAGEWGRERASRRQKRVRGAATHGAKLSSVPEKT